MFSPLLVLSMLLPVSISVVCLSKKFSPTFSLAKVAVVLIILNVYLSCICSRAFRFFGTKALALAP
ncbi:hypothetical protein C2G38_2097649 [Gigaspora rosea]|uniref:Uncharacterized protein n=1 Tax=Gigaspora rosea TaxID=44941 RepID=A0A397UY97_9GLOM|nr:hypothetical protein C2G38_2097649 [Gigaspora rosea]